MGSLIYSAVSENLLQQVINRQNY